MSKEWDMAFRVLANKDRSTAFAEVGKKVGLPEKLVIKIYFDVRERMRAEKSILFDGIRINLEFNELLSNQGLQNWEQVEDAYRAGNLDWGQFHQHLKHALDRKLPMKRSKDAERLASAS